MAACPQKGSKSVPKGNLNSTDAKEEFNSDTLFLISPMLISEKVKWSLNSFSQYDICFLHHRANY